LNPTGASRKSKGGGAEDEGEGKDDIGSPSHEEPGVVEVSIAIRRTAHRGVVFLVS